jgi:predicted nuclease with RNAse H fold
MIVAERPGAPRLQSDATVVGIDLRSGPRHPTGLAVVGLDRRLRRLEVVRTDEAIAAAIEWARPRLVCIDAPLALPAGRCCADATCACASAGISRAVDRFCAAAGYRPFPTLLPSMVGLTLRGIALAARLASEGVAVAEVYPGMAQDILGLPRKQAGLDALARGLRGLGVRGLRRTATHDEVDAATCALVGVLHLQGATERFETAGEPPFVFPRRVQAAGTIPG